MIKVVSRTNKANENGPELHSPEVGERCFLAGRMSLDLLGLLNSKLDFNLERAGYSCSEL